MNFHLSWLLRWSWWTTILLKSGVSTLFIKYNIIVMFTQIPVTTIPVKRIACKTSKIFPLIVHSIPLMLDLDLFFFFFSYFEGYGQKEKRSKILYVYKKGNDNISLNVGKIRQKDIVINNLSCFLLDRIFLEGLQNILESKFSFYDSIIPFS